MDYFYTRCQNPTNDLVAAKIADLEGGVAAVLTSSGQSAIFILFLIFVKQETM
jgi:OAH_OAS_sulfhy: O-acetylhomoserine aminocarboxypropyltransferase/cysteine synthase